MFGAFCQGMFGLENFLPTNGFSIKPLEVKLLAGEQKLTEAWCKRMWRLNVSSSEPCFTSISILCTFR